MNRYRVHFEPMDVTAESPETIPVSWLYPEVSRIVTINKEGFEIS